MQISGAVTCLLARGSRKSYVRPGFLLLSQEEYPDAGGGRWSVLKKTRGAVLLETQLFPYINRNGVLVHKDVNGLGADKTLRHVQVAAERIPFSAP